MSNRFVIYCRKSTDEKDKQVLSIETQLAELREFAHRERLEVVGEYTEAKTAKSPGRSVFKQVIGLIESGSANAILSWAPDRLARNSIDGGYLIYLLDTGKLGDLKFPSFWFENTPQGKFMLNIAFGQSKYYVDNLSENVKRGNRQKLRNGIWPNRAPYGYKNNRETRGIVVVPEKAKTVKGVFATFATQSVSYTHLASMLLPAGIAKKNGQPVGVDRIKHMLANPFYIGILKYNGELYVGKHTTFIPKSLFNQVQTKLDKLNRPQYGKHSFAFSGLMRCNGCGATITAENHTKHYKWNDRRVSYTYYRCTKKLTRCT
jgi:DNA invertase Pin-like site-specific DNA recombinase